MKELVKDVSVLYDRAEEIDIKNEELQSIINDCKDYLLEHKDQNIITAPQLGYQYRLFCMAFEDQIKTFVNPIITKSEGLHLTIESSIMFEGKRYLIPRNDAIIVTYQTPTGQVESNRFESGASELFQQCINLLDGVLIEDIGLEIDEDFENASEEEKQQVVDYYINHLKEQNEKIKEDVNNDKELKQSMDAIKFMTGVQTGEIQLKQVLTPKGRKATMRNFVAGRKRK